MVCNTLPSLGSLRPKPPMARTSRLELVLPSTRLPESAMARVRLFTIIVEQRNCLCGVGSSTKRYCHIYIYCRARCMASRISEPQTQCLPRASERESDTASPDTTIGPACGCEFLVLHHRLLRCLSRCRLDMGHLPLQSISALAILPSTFPSETF